MSEDNSQQQGEGNTGEETPVESPEQNIKAEFNRKLQNINETLATQNARMEEIYNNIIASKNQGAAQAPAGKSLKDLMYDDPEAYAAAIAAKAVSSANEAVEKRVQVSTATSAVVADLQARYPEFSQQNSEAARIAIQKVSQQSQALRGTPEGIKLAMMEAVAELGLVPASKRQQQGSQGDDFSLAGKSGGARKSADPKKDIDPVTLAFAQEMGFDLTDSKRMESLKQASNRKNWNRYS